MGKLHELLAVEGNLETQAEKVRADLANAFEKKAHLFREKKTVFKPSVEDERESTTVECDLQTTVKAQLDELSEYLAKSWDAAIQVAETNTKARADIVLEDDEQTVLVVGMTATSLLDLEKKVAKVRELLKSIQTLDSAMGFQADPQRGANVWKAREVVKTKTKKVHEVITKAQPTKEHPAQTELLWLDKPIGELHEQEWSGLITPAEKTQLLARVEMLERAVRKARSRANDTEVEANRKVAKKLLQFVFDGAK